MTSVRANAVQKVPVWQKSMSKKFYEKGDMRQWQ